MRMRINKARGRFDGLDVADVKKFCKVRCLVAGTCSSLST